MCKFDQTFIEELMPTLFKLLQKLKRRKDFQTHLRVQHYPHTKAKQEHYKKRKPQTNIFDEHTCKNSQNKIPAN